VKKFLVLGLLATSLAGCSTAPRLAEVPPEQYCYTSSQTEVSNSSVVNSKTVLECSDSPTKRAKLVGVDEKNCRRWERRDIVNGREKHYGGYICRDEKGNWRPLDRF
jgi:hypothetical protein